ncbi:MAG: hypothetical protein SFU27_08610 [Thermonemataceae bacterium]|nr:hypothetical protein [Thermonemataceae bacterium]
MKHYVLGFALLFSLGACESGKNEHKHKDGEHQHKHEGMKLGAENQKLFDEVMAVHDEVMPKHHTIAKYRDSLKAELADEKLKKDTATLHKYEKIHKDLDYAYKAMSMWMQEFDTNLDKKPEAEQKAYLEKQKEAIDKVSESMKSSLAAAESRKK